MAERRWPSGLQCEVRCNFKYVFAVEADRNAAYFWLLSWVLAALSCAMRIPAFQRSAGSAQPQSLRMSVHHVVGC